MKKLVLATLLTLLSFNANARCFDEVVNEDWYKCTVREGITSYKQNDNIFIIYSAGFLRGNVYALQFTAMKNGYPFLAVTDCTDYSLALVHDIMYDRVKNGDFKLDNDYHTSLTITQTERFFKCLDKKQQ